MSDGIRCNSNLARLVAGFAALEFAIASTAASAAPLDPAAAVAVAVAPVRVQDLRKLTTAVGTVAVCCDDVLKPRSMAVVSCARFLHPDRRDRDRHRRSRSSGAAEAAVDAMANSSAANRRRGAPGWNYIGYRRSCSAVN